MTKFWQIKNTFQKISHHSFIITTLKSQLVKGNSKTKLHCDYSEFNMGYFKAELDDKLNSGIEYSNFQSIFIQVFNNNAPAMQKIVHFNNSSLMTKTLRRTILHGSTVIRNWSGVFRFPGGAGRWAINLWRLDTFFIFPNFLKSPKFPKDISRSATREEIRIYHVYK